MDFDIKCRSREAQDQAQIAIDKIKSIILELGLRPTNVHVGSGLGGNPKQLLILHALEHVLTDKQAGVFFDKHVCYWNVASVVTSTRRELRGYIDTAFEQKVPNSKGIGSVMLIGHLLSDGAESKFLDPFVIDSSMLPEVKQILEGHQFDITKLTPMDLLLVSAVSAGLLSRKLDKVPDETYLGLDSTVNNVGSFFSCLPLETALIVLRSMVGLDRLVMKNIDENEYWDRVLSKIGCGLRTND